MFAQALGSFRRFRLFRKSGRRNGRGKKLLTLLGHFSKPCPESPQNAREQVVDPRSRLFRKSSRRHGRGKKLLTLLGHFSKPCPESLQNVRAPVPGPRSRLFRKSSNRQPRFHILSKILRDFPTQVSEGRQRRNRFRGDLSRNPCVEETK